MQYSFLFLNYITWHYTEACKSIWRIAGNLSWFFYHFFSIPLLISTLWKPWHKLSSVRQTGTLDLENMLGNFIINFLMRVVGFCVRACVITIGLLFVFGMYAVGALFTIFWFVAPLVALCAMLVGIKVII